MPASHPGPLLLALLAFQRGWLTRERLLEATAMWMATPGMDVAKLLVDARYLTEEQRAELERLIEEWEHAPPSAGSAMSPGLRETLVALRRAGQRPSEAPAVRGEKYELGPELGRGGVGRVIEATDRELGRSVALKLMLEDAPGDLLERFRWEARITGRFDHPNIVTVHEIGTLPGTKEIFFAMKKIVGRDLGWAIAEGRPLRKLVEAVRDACRAVSYAHSQGVVHRDLKPANIMLGDFGEVLVVDWGLARMLGQEDTASQIRRASTVAARPGRIARQEETANLTLEGDILGTPAYMPPEQAMGWLSAIDERSDVYSLGATLYEVLTGRPPYDGKMAQEVVSLVVRGGADPPSKFNACPPELEAICLKAMAYQSGERYPTAKALQEALEAWLEGTLERERRERLAAEHLAAGKAALSRWRALSERTAEAAKRADDAFRATAAHAPVETYRKVFAMEDEAQRMEVESVQALADADDAFDGVLSQLPEHAEARQLKAEVHWERFLLAERLGDHAGEILAKRRVAVFNDGAFDARLRGDGTLEVRTRAYGCRCLLDGRDVAPQELRVGVYHPWSGRRWDGIETDTLADVEPLKPLRLRVHAASCEPSPLEGAEVWAYRHEPFDRILIPVTPGDAPAGPAPPFEVLEEMYGASPYRPRGAGVYLGRTPVAKRDWARGSWLLIVTAPGRVPQRVPFEVKRGKDTVVDATLFLPGEIPTGHLAVLGGAFETLREVGGTQVWREDVVLEDAFVARFPVTCREYCDALNALDREDPGAARERAPRSGERSGWWWPKTGQGWVVPTAAWLASAPDGERARAGRIDMCEADWQEDWPVVGISWCDSQHYLRRLSAERGWLFTLPPIPLRERASRGDAHRRFPWGDFGIGPLSNTNQSREGKLSPAPVDSYPWDESPWGIRGVAGNVSDKCLSDAGPSYRSWRALRGGGWNRVLAVARTSYHHGGTLTVTAPNVGFRSTAVVRLDRP